MEYLVKNSKKARILELKRRNMKITDSDNQYVVSIKEDTAYPCLHLTKGHEGNKINTMYPENPIRRIQEVILFYNGLEVPTRQILDSKGAIPSKTIADAKVAIQEMAEYFKNDTMEHLGQEDVNKVKDLTTPNIAHSKKKGKPSKKLTILNLNSKQMNETRQTTIPFPIRLNDHYYEEEKGKYGLQFMEANSYGASHIDNTIPRKEKDPGSFTLPCYINNVCFDNALADLGASVSVMPLSTYLNLRLGELAHTKLTMELADRTVKYPKGIAKNVLVCIGKFVFLVDFIILDMPEDIKVPLIVGRPFLSTAHAKIDVFKRKITLRVGDEKIIFKSVKPASSLIKRVYILSLRERMELDFKARLMGETLVLNRSLDPLYGDYIELNDLNDKLEYNGNDVVRALMNIPIFVGTFFVLTDFIVLEDMGAYRDEGMGKVIFGEPFLREVRINARRFEGIITIYNGNDEVTYQLVRSHLSNYGVTCEDEAKRRNSRTKTNTFENCYLLLYAVSSKEDMAYQRQLITRIRVISQFPIWRIHSSPIHRMHSWSHGKVYNWETATYGKIWDNEDVLNRGSIETEFLAIVFNDTLTSEAPLSYEPTVSSLNDNEINFRISFDESDDEDYTVVFDKNSFCYKIIYANGLKTNSENDNEKINMPLFPSPEPSVGCIDDLDFFKDFENEFSAIIYNDALTSKSDFSTEPTLCLQHINEFNLKDETSLSECDEKEQNVLYFNELFSFDVIYLGDLKSNKDNDDDDDKINIKQSLGDMSVIALPNVINTDVGAYAR
nr:hypothetical protein [Tanacetum cinerariifolium]